MYFGVNVLKHEHDDDGDDVDDTSAESQSGVDAGLGDADEGLCDLLHFGRFLLHPGESV